MGGMKSTPLLMILLCGLGSLISFALEVNAQELVAKNSELWTEVYDPPYRQPQEIPKGSELRKALFDQLRPKISAMVKGRKDPLQRFAESVPELGVLFRRNSRRRRQRDGHR